MNRVGFFYDDIYLGHIPPGFHPESPHRLNSIVNKMKKSDVWDKLKYLEPEKASFKDLETVHSREYIERIKGLSPGYIDPDTYLSEGTVEAAILAAGAVMTAVDKCRDGTIDMAFCAVRPPGHHAERDRAMGFCIFNNVAVGARYAQARGYRKVFIVDFDVHHGNGTEHIFYSDSSVFYFSTHQYPHYPGTGSEQDRGEGEGEGFTYNIPMPSGTGDREYEKAYTEILHSLVGSFDPDIILVSAGYDLHADDPLSGINVTDRGINNIVEGILSAKRGIPYVFSLEGGYNLDALSDSVLITVRSMIKSC
jgi:acetoin utilization deacetylase AcuC-like enzyme